jgi:hypothetical protein
VPGGADQTVYLVENNFGRSGRAFVETESEYADLEGTITALLEGQCSNPIRVAAFNTADYVANNPKLFRRTSQNPR